MCAHVVLQTVSSYYPSTMQSVRGYVNICANSGHHFKFCQKLFDDIVCYKAEARMAHAVSTLPLPIEKVKASQRLDSRFMKFELS